MKWEQYTPDTWRAEYGLYRVVQQADGRFLLYHLGSGRGFYATLAEAMAAAEEDNKHRTGATR